MSEDKSVVARLLKISDQIKEMGNLEVITTRLDTIISLLSIEKASPPQIKSFKFNRDADGLLLDVTPVYTKEKSP